MNHVEKKNQRLRLLSMVVLILFLFSSLHAADRHSMQRYIVQLHNPPVAAYMGEEFVLPNGKRMGEQMAATSPVATGENRLNLNSPNSRAYLDRLKASHESFLLEVSILLGRVVSPKQVYFNATNGMALDLTADEAALLSASPFVRSLQEDEIQKLQLDAGPPWLKADEIWNGASGFAATRGENVVVGIIDSGINWDHPFFADPSADGHDFQNPFGMQLGLCSKAEVACNDKLVGVYDFIVDNPSTDEVEENTNGRDNGGHGSHVAGIAVGNRLNVTLNGIAQTFVSGVAPRANVVSYRACFEGDPNDLDGGGCVQSAILSAIDQAITDGVDVVNYSIGTSAFNPWRAGGIPMAFLNMRNAGIFAVTSAGNDGPNGGTIGSPADAPWIVSVGNATHDRIFGSVVQNLSGGDTPPPPDLLGVSTTAGIGVRKIVHAKDFGNALCGTGPSESEASCAGNTGQSNPWKGQMPFNGEIVVCDRGTYGRVEKGKNVQLAGAGGYILANTDAQGNSVVSEDHCLPASHITDFAGDLLRTWLASGSNHQGSLSGITAVKDDEFGDIVSASSSRGPVLSPVQDLLKPNVIAPGTSIISSSNLGEEFRSLSGTSMASPHIAGAAALVRAVHPGWSVSQVSSALETTSTSAIARDFDGAAATPHERGAGRPRIGNAVNAGLFLDVTGAEFAAADPSLGGIPRNLNLPGLVNSSCKSKCSFTRKVTDQQGGGSWTASTANFPAGTIVTINPANFTLINGASRSLAIEVNVANANKIGSWVYGDIVLSSNGSPDQVFTTAVFSSGGNLPASWNITDDRNIGFQNFNLSGLVGLPDLTLKTGGLVAPTRTVRTIKEDPTNDGVQSKGSRNVTLNEDPYDGGEGVFTVWHNLPQGGLWLYAETLASSSEDLDLFVGRDDNQNGVADEDEELCTSTSPIDLEECNLFDLPPGNYWIVVQNWAGVTPAGDDVTLLSAAVVNDEESPMIATGPGIVAENQSFEVQVSWRDLPALPGEQWLGAVGIGSNRNQPNNIGVVPVRFNRSAIESPKTLPLINGESQSLALAANGANERIFVDVPPGTTSLKVEASGMTGAQSNALKMDIYRQDFDQALASAPFATLPGGSAVIASSTGASNNGPSITLTSNLLPGRYYVRMSNTSMEAVGMTLSTTLQSGKGGLQPFKGLWRMERNNFQGAEYNSIGAFDYVLWYSFDSAGGATFYNTSAPAPTGNVWVSNLVRYTNDGANQQSQIVGKLVMTFIDNNRLVYSYSLMGLAGSDPMVPLSPNSCPDSNKSYHGTWGKQQVGLGGATVVVYTDSEAQIHYLFDGKGAPRFLLSSGNTNQPGSDQAFNLLQLQAYCATCDEVEVITTEVGTTTRKFVNETNGTWTLNYSAFTPSHQVNRTDPIIKLSDNLQCQ